MVFHEFYRTFFAETVRKADHFGRTFKSQNNLFVNGVFHCMMDDSPSSSEGCTGILPLLAFQSFQQWVLAIDGNAGIAGLRFVDTQHLPHSNTCCRP